MGTRAAFFLGDPRDFVLRKWLGCVTYDGYPAALDGLIDIKSVRNDPDAGRDSFLCWIEELSERDDFTDPSKHGWPFPWDFDLFLTDFIYAWFNDAVQVASYYRGFVPIKAVFEEGFEYDALPRLPNNVLTPRKYDPSTDEAIVAAVMDDLTAIFAAKDRGGNE